MLSFRWKSRSEDRGAYLVLFAILVPTVFLAVFAFVFGTGAVGTGVNKLQSVNNLAALAALDEYLNATGTPIARMTAAKSRANDVFAENEFQFIKNSLELDSGDTSSGSLKFGRWVRTLEDAAVIDNSGGIVTKETCGAGTDDYPCFIDYTGRIQSDALPDGVVPNAVRFKAQTAASNLMKVPFVERFMRGNEFSVSTETTATIVQRCVAFLVDMSSSVVAETHDYFNKTDPLPDNYGHVSYIDNFTASGNTWDTHFPSCGSAKFGNAGLRPASLLGCHLCTDANDRARCFFWHHRMDTVSGVMEKRSDTVDVDYRHHYPEDYAHWTSSVHKVPDTVGHQNLVLDLYRPAVAGVYYGPEPFTRFMRAINLSLDNLIDRGSGADQAMMLAVRGDYDIRRDRFPKFAKDSATGILTSDVEPLTRDFNLLKQLTNVTNSGTLGLSAGGVPEVQGVIHPNYLDVGMFPWTTTYDQGIPAQTNLIKGIVEAAHSLTSCPNSAQRVIVVATDGLPTCFCEGSYDSNGVCQTNYRCQKGAGSWYEYNRYMEAEEQLLNEIQKYLNDEGIMLTALQDSSLVGPNFLNLKYDSNGDGTKDAYYKDLYKAYEAGYGGLHWDDASNSVVSPSDALIELDCGHGNAGCARGDYKAKSAGKPFTRAVGLWAGLSLQTGGIYCPLLPKCVSSTSYDGYTLSCSGGDCYECPDGGSSCSSGDKEVKVSVRDQFVGAGRPQLCAIRNESQYQQAFRCVMETFGLNPYLLVEEG